jgi:hypothetical protein
MTLYSLTLFGGNYHILCPFDFLRPQKLELKVGFIGIIICISIALISKLEHVIEQITS